MEHDPAEAGQGPSAAGGSSTSASDRRRFRLNRYTMPRGPGNTACTPCRRPRRKCPRRRCAGVVVHIHHAAVVDIRLHGVPLDPHRQLRSPGHLAGNGNGLIVLVEHRGGISGGGGTGIQGMVRGPAGAEGAPTPAAGPPGPGPWCGPSAGPPGSAGGIPPAGPAPRRTGCRRGHGRRPGTDSWGPPQGVKQPQQHLLGSTDAGFIVSHRRPGNSQPACQLHPGDAQLLPALAQLFAKAHAFALLRRGSPHAVDSVPHLLVLVNSFNKDLVNLGLT